MPSAISIWQFCPIVAECFAFAVLWEFRLFRFYFISIEMTLWVPRPRHHIYIYIIIVNIRIAWMCAVFDAAIDFAFYAYIFVFLRGAKSLATHTYHFRVCERKWNWKRRWRGRRWRWRRGRNTEMNHCVCVCLFMSGAVGAVCAGNGTLNAKNGRGGKIDKIKINPNNEMVAGVYYICHGKIIKTAINHMWRFLSFAFVRSFFFRFSCGCTMRLRYMWVDCSGI